MALLVNHCGKQGKLCPHVKKMSKKRQKEQKKFSDALEENFFISNK